MNMNHHLNCSQFELLLDDLLDGTLSPEERKRADEHLATCAACREIYTVVQDNAAALLFDNDELLTEAILAETAGQPCRRAEELLCDYIDGALATDERALLKEHLSHCRECGALAENLAWLNQVLPEMAELVPDRAFADDVLEHTSRAVSPLAGAIATIASWWRGVVQRPRFSLEGAYIGILIVIGLFGTPISPMKEATPRALELVKAGPGGLASALAPEIEFISGVTRRGGRVIWLHSGGRIGQKLGTLSDDLSRRRQRIEPGLVSLDQHGDKLGEALLDFDFVLSVAQIREIQGDITQIRQLWREDDSTEETIDTGRQSGSLELPPGSRETKGDSHG